MDVSLISDWLICIICSSPILPNKNKPSSSNHTITLSQWCPWWLTQYPCKGDSFLSLMVASLPSTSPNTNRPLCLSQHNNRRPSSPSKRRNKRSHKESFIQPHKLQAQAQKTPWLHKSKTRPRGSNIRRPCANTGSRQKHAHSALCAHLPTVNMSSEVLTTLCLKIFRAKITWVLCSATTRLRSAVTFRRLASASFRSTAAMRTAKNNSEL